MVGKRIAFLFPGQGAQYPGMGLDLAAGTDRAAEAAKTVFAAASEALGRDMIALIGESDGETLKRTDLSQPALCAVSLAAAAYLKERGVVPAACAGFSLGEYPALACAGVVSAADCFRLTERRGRAMQAVCERLRSAGAGPSGGAGEGGGGEPGMAAVLGLAPEKAEELIARWKREGSFEHSGEIFAANINSPKQMVVSGTAAALSEAEKRFKEAGARRVLRLKVAGPFHSPLMAEAARSFGEFLETVSFSDPAIPLFSNVTGKRIASGAEAKALALRQIVQGVRWTDEEAAVAELKPAAVLEVGPGGVLQGLWRDAGSGIPAYGAGSAGEIDGFLRDYQYI
jgi:[acyl-carrier-protein] S-malonyltransferase